VCPFLTMFKNDWCTWLTDCCWRACCPSMYGTYLWLSIDVNVCAFLLLPWFCVRSPPSDACWIVANFDKIITALLLSLELGVWYSDHTSLSTERTKRTLICGGSTRKKKTNHWKHNSRLWRTPQKYAMWELSFTSQTLSKAIHTFDAQTLPKTRDFFFYIRVTKTPGKKLYSVHEHVGESKNFCIRRKNTPENKTEILKRQEISACLSAGLSATCPTGAITFFLKKTPYFGRYQRFREIPTFVEICCHSVTEY